MEFKNINALSITDCLEALNVDRNVLKNELSKIRDVAEIHASTIRVQLDELNNLRQVICSRLLELLREDWHCYINASSLMQLEAYLQAHPDGLWVEEAAVKADRIRCADEERRFFESNKNTISGCRKYLHKYPRGRFVNDANHIIAAKQRNNKIRRLTIAAIVIVVLSIVSILKYHSVSYLNLSSDTSVGKRGGKITCQISTDALDENINFYKTADWLDVELNGKGLTINVKPNHDASKSATIKVYGYTTLFGINLSKEEREITISQDSGLPTLLTVTNQNVEFEKYGGALESNIIAITDGMDLDIDTDIDWVDITKMIKPDGDNQKVEISISAGTNEGGFKEGTITVTAKDLKKTIRVSQESGLASYFDVSIKSGNSTLIMDEEGTDENHYYPIYVKTDGTVWYVDDKPYWLNTEVKMEKGELRVTLGKNTGQIKTGTIKLRSNNGDIREIDVKQWGDPTNLSASRSSIRFDTSSDYEYVNINNDSKKHLSISVSSGDSNWLSASVRSKEQIKVSCSTNNSSPRSGTIYIDCGGERTSITIKQDGWEDCRSCNGSGQVNCTNYSAQWRYYPYTGANLHQTYEITGQYYNLGTWWPQYGWVNCKHCGGGGRIDCSSCKGKGRKKKSY